MKNNYIHLCYAVKCKYGSAGLFDIPANISMTLCLTMNTYIKRGFKTGTVSKFIKESN